MTVVTRAEAVMQARQVLKEWDGKTSAGEVVKSIRAILAPLASGTDELSADAREKFDEVNARLERLADSMPDVAQRESLDTLMLGLWIRLELLAESASEEE